MLPELTTKLNKVPLRPCTFTHGTRRGERNEMEGDPMGQVYPDVGFAMDLAVCA